MDALDGCNGLMHWMEGQTSLWVDGWLDGKWMDGMNLQVDLMMHWMNGLHWMYVRMHWIDGETGEWTVVG